MSVMDKIYENAMCEGYYRVILLERAVVPGNKFYYYYYYMAMAAVRSAVSGDVGRGK